MSYGIPCPDCGKCPLEHDDYTCEFRWFHDTVNHDSGWIPVGLDSVIPKL